jgi:hypothetical protein
MDLSSISSEKTNSIISRLSSEIKSIDSSINNDQIRSESSSERSLKSFNIEEEFYGEDYPEEEFPERDYGFEQDIDIDEIGGEIFREARKTKDVIQIDKDSLIDPSQLTSEELYLPLSHLISPIEQWEICLRAINSGFRYVNNLSKVTDFTLKKILNIITYSVSKNGNSILPYGAIKLFEYGIKRNC